jgi:hypothetical protein
MSVNARQTRIGINIATSGSWSTGTAIATAVGAGDGIRVRDDFGVQLKQMYSDDDSAGQSFIGSVQAGNTEAVRASIPTYLHYSDVFQNVLWALAFGTGGTSPVQIGATTAYSNTFEPSTNKDNRYCTIVRDKSQYISEVPGAKCTGFELTFGEAGRAEIMWTFIGDREVTDSVINTATQVSALTYPAQGLRAFFRQAVLRLNAQAGGALAGSDKLYVSSIKVNFVGQAYDEVHVAGAATIIEPAETNHLEASIELTFARFDAASDDFFAAHRDVTLYKGDLTLTGPAIATTSYAMLFQWPNLAVTDFNAPIPGGGGNSAPTMRLKAYSTTAAPTGMTGVTVPIRLTTTGSATANPFA